MTETRVRIAVIGTGRMGTALARQLAAGGYEVRVGSRDPERGRQKAAESGAAFGGSYRTAAANAEVVILAVPFAAAFESLTALGPLDGVVVIDVTNPFADEARDPTASCAERIQAFVPEAHVVKAWNHLYSAVVRRSPDFGGVAATVFVAGDDAESKALVAALATRLGYDPVDAGPIASARYLEPLAELMTTLDRLGGGDHVHALKLLERDRPRRTTRREPQELAPTWAD
jgi:8-hydroxy-5-deazaflavin:NADPH oxidoreductase